MTKREKTKRGGINDMPYGWGRKTELNRRIYSTWLRMIDRCNDRATYPTYSECVVCDEWLYLSNFIKDIKNIPGYDKWVMSKDMELDKDILGNGNMVYSPKTCCFVSHKKNMEERNNRCGNITRNSKYQLEKDGDIMLFDSQRDACRYLGVSLGYVSKAYYAKKKLRGYTVTKLYDYRIKHNVEVLV